MKCPNCGLINPDEAILCDCGYNFKKEKLEKPKTITNIGEKALISQVNAFNIIGVTIISIIGIIILLSSFVNLFDLLSEELEIAHGGILIGILILTLGNLFWIMLCKKWKLFIETKTQLILIYYELLGKEK
ncbi:MAG: hypothetical protein ACTSR2_02930 [Candidatus Hodarchaeales archaeon]